MNMRVAGILFGGGLLLTGVGAGTGYWLMSSLRPEAAARPAKGRVEAARAEVSPKARARSASLASYHRASPAPVANEDVPTAKAARSVVEEPAPPPTEVGANQVFSNLKREVAEEPLDRAWAHERETAALSILQEDIRAGKFGGPVSIEEVHCGNVRCSVTATLSGGLTEGRALGDRVGEALDLGRARARLTPVEGGSFRLEVIAARYGYKVDGSRERTRR